MSFTININHAAIQQLSNAQKQALEMTAEAIKTDVMTNAVTPKKSGVLERSANVDISKLNEGKAKLTYDTSYAARVYFHPELNFRTDLNANAQGEWLERWITGDKRDFAVNTYKRLFRQLAGGVVK